MLYHMPYDATRHTIYIYIYTEERGTIRACSSVCHISCNLIYFLRQLFLYATIIKQKERYCEIRFDRFGDT